MSISIRPAVPADAAALAELAARTFRETFESDNAAQDIEVHLAQAYGAAQQGRELADASVVTLLVEAAGSLVGYAQLRRGKVPGSVSGDAPIELWRFYLDGAHQGRGIAQALMQRVDLEATRAGAHTLWLGVWERNERAKAFYRKCGFVDVGSHVFVVGSDAQTDRLFARPVKY